MVANEEEQKRREGRWGERTKTEVDDEVVKETLPKKGKQGTKKQRRRKEVDSE